MTLKGVDAVYIMCSLCCLNLLLTCHYLWHFSLSVSGTWIVAGSFLHPSTIHLTHLYLGYSCSRYSSFSSFLSFLVIYVILSFHNPSHPLVPCVFLFQSFLLLIGYEPKYVLATPVEQPTLHVKDQVSIVSLTQRINLLSLGKFN